MSNHEVTRNRPHMMRIAGYNGNGPLFEIDPEAGTITNVVTGESLDFSGQKNKPHHRPPYVEVPSQYDQDKTYIVYMHDVDDVTSWTCTCPDFVNRLRDTDGRCKHIGYVLHNGAYARYAPTTG